MDIGNVDDMDRNTRFPPPSRLLACSIRTSFESPWQNGVAERWVESCRRDLLDHVIAVNERHLKRLLSEYVRYYHKDRTHLGLRKATPDYRIRSTASGRVLSQDRLGGLHHRYDRAA
jgi:putative transposase